MFLYAFSSWKFTDTKTESTQWKNNKFTCFCDYFAEINNQFLLFQHLSYLSTIEKILYPRDSAIKV